MLRFPKIGRIVASDEASYQYLVESIQKFPDQQTFNPIWQKEALDCSTRTACGARSPVVQ